MAYDPAAGGVLLFGLSNCNFCPTYGTWLYRQGNWTNLTSSDSPPVIGVLAYDPGDQGVLAVEYWIGGTQTWLFRGSHWYNVSANQSVFPAYPDTMATDSTDQSVLLLGDSSRYSTLETNQTWIFKNGRWSELHPSTYPSGRNWVALSDDPAQGGVLLFGGVNYSSNTTTLLNDTWLFRNGTWANVTPLSRSPQIQGGDMASVNGRVILWGGLLGTGYYNGTPTTVVDNGTWTLTAGNWTPVVTTGAYGNQSLNLIIPTPGTFDAGDGYLLYGWDLNPMFGFYNDTWAPVPIVGSLSANSSLYVGNPLKFSAHWTGGFGPFTCAWAVTAPVTQVGAGCAGSVAVTSAGNGTVTMWINDSAYESLHLSRSFVSALPLGSISLLAPSRADVGQTIGFSANASGGIPPLTVLWAFGDGGESMQWAPSYSYFSVGNFTVTVTVTDGANSAIQRSTGLSVAPRPTGQIRPASALFDANEPLGFDATIQGGVPPYNLSVSFGDGSEINLTGLTTTAARFNHTFPVRGSYSVFQTLVDALGISSASSTKVTISPSLQVSVTAPVSPGLVGQIITMNVTVRGGTPPFRYAWTWGDGSTSSGSNASHVYSSIGNFNVTLTARDGGGGNVSSTAVVSVMPVPSTSGPGTSGGLLLWVGGGVIGVAAGVGAIFLFFRRRRGGASPPEDAEEPVGAPQLYAEPDPEGQADMRY